MDQPRRLISRASRTPRSKVLRANDALRLELVVKFLEMKRTPVCSFPVFEGCHGKVTLMDTRLAEDWHADHYFAEPNFINEIPFDRVLLGRKRNARYDSVLHHPPFSASGTTTTKNSCESGILWHVDAAGALIPRDKLGRHMMFLVDSKIFFIVN